MLEIMWSLSVLHIVLFQDVNVKRDDSNDDQQVSRGRLSIVIKKEIIFVVEFRLPVLVSPLRESAYHRRFTHELVHFLNNQYCTVSWHHDITHNFKYCFKIG